MLTAAPLSSMAQSDPVAAKQARNAALERVSPVMDREKAYQPTDTERVESSIVEIKSFLTDINTTLKDLALVGSRGDQAKLLLNLDSDTRSTLIALLDSEAQRVEEFNREITPSPVSQSTSDVQTIQPEPVKPVSVAPIVVAPSTEQIKPMLVRTYDEIGRPAKVILKIGNRDPEVFFEGETAMVNGVEYEVVAATAIRDSTRLHGRKVYEILLKGNDGIVKNIEWE
ncbi:MAG: hypothetical protein AAF197_00355 [Pseudomonadota bacterium]